VKGLLIVPRQAFRSSKRSGLGSKHIVRYLLAPFCEKAAADLYLNFATSPDHLADNTPVKFRCRYLFRDVRV
jgi:hypothetical protein